VLAGAGGCVLAGGAGAWHAAIKAPAQTSPPVARTRKWRRL
jgi:hypothetical protein